VQWRPNVIGNDLTAEYNQNHIDIADNRRGTSPYAIGIASNLTVLFNAVLATSPVVESNFVGNNATCQAGTKKDADGTPNIVDGSNDGCG
jgi:hypothetical protein